METYVVRMDERAPQASQTRKDKRSRFSIRVSGRWQTGHITNLLAYTPTRRLIVSLENFPWKYPLPRSYEPAVAISLAKYFKT